MILLEMLAFIPVAGIRVMFLNRPITIELRSPALRHSLCPQAHCPVAYRL